MADFNFRESSHRFTSPIRLFTANDPYVWSVDNIPLKELAENDLWLKDQLTQGIKLSSIKRGDFDELRPRVEGNDNKVKVLPGRFSARINDIDTSRRLQVITRLTGSLFNQAGSWRMGFYNNPDLKTNIDKISSATESDAMFMNGMIERAFVYPAKDPYTPFIDYRLTNRAWEPLLPIQDVLLWAKNTNTEFTITNWQYWTNAVGMAPETQVASQFTKFWRGITRISIVDVPNELEIEVPEFNLSDFDYIDENGVRRQRSEAEIRIDMVFIYSKPIDASSVKVVDSKNTNKFRHITQPELGLVRGAGIILNKSIPPRTSAFILGQQDSSGVDENGNSMILASVADAENTAGGFQSSGIYGSFPSPDDLMNIAPMISEILEDSDPLLVGQSILPVAYVIVRKTADKNVDGINIITSTDLIDIRPFFRTAELSYNERAGIAASIPQLSISNPVVSKLELKHTVRSIVDDYTSKVNGISGRVAESLPRAVGAGYILGGSRYGVEGAIQHFYSTSVDPTANQARLNQILLSRYGYHQNQIIPELPDWDVADWVFANNLSQAGDSPNDYIHTFTRAGVDHQYSCYSDKNKTQRLARLGTDNINGIDNYINIHFVKKTVRLDRSSVQWMQDYFVNVQLLNCVPLGCRTSTGHFQYAGAADIWVEKKTNEFTIYCAWVANDPFQGENTTENVTLAGAQNFRLPFNNRDTAKFAGFTVMVNEIASAPTGNTKFQGEPAAGAAIYPSVTFEIIGIPQGFAGLPNTLQGSNPVITLS